MESRFDGRIQGKVLKIPVRCRNTQMVLWIYLEPFKAWRYPSFSVSCRNRILNSACDQKGVSTWNAIAKRFGGGGHINAAACRIKGDVSAVKRLVLAEIEASCKQ